MALLGSVTLAADGPGSEPIDGTSFKAPTLSAASSFGRGWRERDAAAAARIGVEDFRDAVYWSRVERRAGRYVFDKPRETWPDRVAEAGARASLTVNWGNPLYDGQATPYTSTGIAGFAAFAAELAARFPNVDAIEVGNEFNGWDFVKGPVREMRPLERARHHASMLNATRRAVDRVRPDMRLLGGATHSLPLAYIWTVLEAGGAEAMDALAVHPYTTRPEHLARQVEVMRRHKLARDMPLEITEFAAPPESAPAHLAKMMCAMSLSGVSRAAWYPLRGRKGERLQPLIGPDGSATPVGEAFAFAMDRMAGQAVADVSPDPFTHACLFDKRTLVIWGEERDVSLGAGATAVDARGQPVAEPRISREVPLIVVSDEPIALGKTVELAHHALIADSFDQFAYGPVEWDGSVELLETAHVPRQPEEAGFELFMRKGGQRLDPVTRPGQERPGVPWVPYMSHPEAGGARVLPGRMLTGGGRAKPTEIVHRYTTIEDGEVSLRAAFTLAGKKDRAIAVRVERNGETIKTASVKGSKTMTLDEVALETGDELDIIASTPTGGKPASARYRISIFDRSRVGAE